MNNQVDSTSKGPHTVGQYTPGFLQQDSLAELAVEPTRKQIITALMDEYKKNPSLDIVSALNKLEGMSPEAVSALQTRVIARETAVNRQAGLLPVAAIVLAGVYFEELMTTAIVAPLGYGSAGVDLVSGNSKEARRTFDQTNKTLEKVWKPKPENISVYGGVTR